MSEKEPASVDSGFDPALPLAMHYSHDKHWRLYERLRHLMGKYTNGSWVAVCHAGFSVHDASGKELCVIEPKDLTSVDARLQYKMDRQVAEARVLEGVLAAEDVDEYVAHLALLRKYGSGV